MKDRVLYEISLKRECYTPELILNWISKVAEIIAPDSMTISTISKNYKKYNAGILRDEIESEEAKEGIEIEICNDEEYFSTHVKEKDARIRFNIRLLKETQRVEKLVENAMCLGYGVSASKCSSTDDFLQSLESIDWYCYYKGSIKGKKTTHPPNRPKKEIIDIEYNPGHHHLEEGIKFGAFQCMWFGRDFYQYIPKEKLKAFSNCFENAELENDVIRIKLYEDMWDYENPVNRNRQRDFRNSVGIDEVAHSLHGRQKPKVTDPVLEILPKDENGNEVTRFYFTSRGKNVRKSQADVERTYTHTPDGKLLHVEHRELKNEDSKDDMD